MFLPLGYSARSFLQMPSVCVCVPVSLASSSVTKAYPLLGWDQVTWLMKNVAFLCFEKLLSCFCSMLWVVIYLCCETLCREKMFILLLLSAFTSSSNATDLVSLVDIYAHAVELLPLCMIVLLNMAVAVPFLLHTFCFLLFWYNPTLL